MVVEAFELTELPDDLRRINSVDCCSGISSIVSAILGALGKTLHGAGKSRLKWKSLIEFFFDDLHSHTFIECWNKSFIFL